MRSLVVVLLSLAAPSCGPEGRSKIDAEIHQIQALTLPPDAQGYTSSPIAHRSYSVAAEWEFHAQMAREAYLLWLEERLPAGFERRRAETGEGRFVRTLLSNVQDVLVDQLPAEQGRLLRIRFMARAF